jgi:hypothetical protein
MATLFKWLTAAFAVMLVSSLVSMMAAFVGSQGADLQDLLKLQAVLVPVSIAVVVWCFSLLTRQLGYGNVLRKFWSVLPGWLIFAVFAVNSLVLVAELSFVLIRYHTAAVRPWQEHLPAATALCSSLALATCYVCFRIAADRE